MSDLTRAAPPAGEGSPTAPARPIRYTTGGTVKASRAVYIDRRADEQLLSLCLERRFAYVLATRQVGKSSLMVRTAERLRQENVRAVIIDLTQMGETELDPERWYIGLLGIIEDRLRLNTDAYAWWQRHTHLGYTQRLILFLEKVVLTEIEEPIIFFIDEIDTTLGLPFTDDFFAAIRYLYNARTTNPTLYRLSFVLIGVATPSELITDPKRTPFNIGQRVNLTDFTREEASILAGGLGLPTDQAETTLDRIMEWTGGHPYLTQRLCAVVAADVAARPEPQADRRLVQAAVERTFFDQHNDDSNIRSVRNMLTRRAAPEERNQVLELYRTVRLGWIPVRDEEQSAIHAHLKLSGVVERQRGLLRVRNRIYRRVFNLAWVNEQLPLLHWWTTAPPTVRILARLTTLLVVLLGFTTGLAIVRSQQATTARLAAEQGQEEALRQTQRADARAYAAQANEIRDRNGLQSLLLAVRAVEATRAEGDNVTAEAEVALYRSLQRMARTIGHPDDLTTVAYSPDGALLLTASADRTGRLWHSDGTLAAILEGHGNAILDAAWSPDGQTIVTGGRDRVARLWSRDGALIAVLEGHTNLVNRVRFSPDGRHVVTASWDGTARLWSRDGTLVALLEGHEAAILDVAISPDSRRIATAAEDDLALIFDLQGNRIATLQGHADRLLTIAWHPDGELLATGSQDGSARIWSRDGSQLLVLEGHRTLVSRVAWSPNGTWLATAGWDGNARIWSADGSLIAVLTGHDGVINQLRISPDGAWLATAGADQTTRIWSAGGQPAAVLAGHTEGVVDVAFSPDSAWLATASADATARLWPRFGQTWATNGAELAVLGPHRSLISAAAESPDGTLLVSASWDEVGWIWTRDGTRVAELSGHGDNMTGVCFLGDDRLVTASWDGTGRLYARDGTPISTLTGHSDRVNTLACSPDGRWIATAGADSTARIWNREGHLAQTLSGHDMGVTSIAFSPDQRLLVTGDGSGTVRIWNMDGELLAAGDSHSNRITTIRFAGDGSWFVSASADATARIWARDGQERAALIGHEGIINDVIITPDDTRLLTVSDDTTARLWQADGTQLQLMEGHRQKVVSAAVSADGRLLATGGGAGEVRLWTGGGAFLVTLDGHSGPVNDLFFDHVAGSLVSAGSDGTLRLWQTMGNLEQMLVRARAGAVTLLDEASCLATPYFTGDDCRLLP